MRVEVDGNSEATEVRFAYSDPLLREIGQRLSGSWRLLGSYLGVTAARMDALVGGGVKTPEELCMEMFKAWWRKSTRDARWRELCLAFIGIDRLDLLLETLTFFHRSGLDYHNPDSRTWGGTLAPNP